MYFLGQVSISYDLQKLGRVLCEVVYWKYSSETSNLKTTAGLSLLMEVWGGVCMSEVG